MKPANTSKLSSTSLPQASTRQRAEQWRSPSNFASFVRCLHLLNLDQFEDWPGITEQTFSTKPALQNLQQRVKCVEWALYRLFEIYDAAETTHKLRPFFPPSTPLNSLNLRAALFRSLTELKKNGLLGRDVVLRKTMLEECKGDKFEEVIGTFAMLVLRNNALKTNQHLAGSVSGQSPQYLDQNQLLPLILAHRWSLQECLRQRKAFEEHASSYEAFLREREDELGKRRSMLTSVPASKSPEGLAAIENKVRDAWLGDEKWADVLLGETSAPNTPLQRSFGISWEDITSTRGAADVSAPTSPLDDLDALIAQHESRLRRWKVFQGSLENAQNARREKLEKSTPRSTPLSSQLQFDKHQTLRFDALKVSNLVSVELLPNHKTLLNSMEDELSRIGQNKRVPQQHSLSGDKGQHPASSSYIGTDRCESPISSHRKSEEKVQRHQAEACDLPYSPISNTLPSPMAHLDSALQEDSNPKKENPSTVKDPERLEHTADNTDLSEGFGVIGNDVKTPERSLPSSSLSERTQKSMAALLGGGIGGSPNKSASATTTPVPSSNLPETDLLTTLLERTRQSMSLLPNPPPRPRKRRDSLAKQSRMSQVFPVNQFETPGRVKSPKLEASPGSGASTPRDKLFSDEAEYASVFKSRPRIALSPALSPERTVVGLDSLLGEGLAELSLGEADLSFQDTPIRRLREPETRAAILQPRTKNT